MRFLILENDLFTRGFCKAKLSGISRLSIDFVNSEKQLLKFIRNERPYDLVLCSRGICKLQLLLNIRENEGASFRIGLMNAPLTSLNLAEGCFLVEAPRVGSFVQALTDHRRAIF